MKELYDKCPSFEECSAPKCPLDSLYHRRVNKLKGEEGCISRKRTRLQIVRENPDYDSPFKGYTGMEYRGIKSYTQACGKETPNRGVL